MEFMGLNDHLTILKTLFPALNNSAEVPGLVKELTAKDSRGIQNSIGFYHYTEEEAKKWNNAFASFNDDIYQLALEYPSVSVTHVVKEKS
jgi:3-hydroxybutyryl-CoA dehydrogenase